MPYKLPTPCSYPGCPALSRNRYCDEHKTIATREYNKYQRDPNHNKIYGRQWRKIRNLYISKHPLCEKCLEADRLIPSEEVHHIKPIDQGGDHSENNLMSLCKSCHTKTR